MRKLFMQLAVIALLVGLIGSVLHGQGVPIDNGTFVIRPLGTVTNNDYQVSKFLSLDGRNSFLLKLSTVQAHTQQTINVKYQWSDSTNFFSDEKVLVAGTVANSEAPYTVASKVIQIGISNASSQIFVDRVNRMGRYFRIAIKSSGVSTATVFGVTQSMIE